MKHIKPLTSVFTLASLTVGSMILAVVIYHTPTVGYHGQSTLLFRYLFTAISIILAVSTAFNLNRLLKEKS